MGHKAGLTLTTLLDHAATSTILSNQILQADLSRRMCVYSVLFVPLQVVQQPLPTRMPIGALLSFQQSVERGFSLSY